MDLSPAILFAGVFGGVIVAVFFLVGLSRKWGMLVPFVGMIMFSAMSLPLTWNDRVKPTIWLPIQSKRSQLFLVFGCIGCLMLMTQLRRLKGKAISLSASLLLCVGLYASLLRFVHNDPVDAASSIFLSTATLVPLLFTASAVIDSFDDVRVLMRGVGVVALIWVGMSVLQILINPRLATMGNEFRFVGLFSNPQHAGAFLAFLCVALLWLVLNDFARYKIMYIILLGVSGVLLLWTGSRTGLGMAVIGVSATLYSRVGRAILILPVAGIVGYIGMKVMVDVLGITLGFDRLASTANTRDYAWWKLYSVAMDNPVFGVGTEDAEKSENSWLYGFASYGFGMFTLLITMTLVAIVEIFKSFKARFQVDGVYRTYFDVFNGMLLMYFAGAVLEGYMISRVSPTLGFFMIAAVANANLRRVVTQGYASTDEDWYSYDGEYDSYADLDSSPSRV